MLVTDYEEPGPYEVPELGSRWTMVFDRASNALGNRIAAVIISPQGCHMPFTARLCFDCTNNMAEYEVCIMGIKVVIDLGIKFLSVYGDSTLVINQVKGEWDMKHQNLIPYGEHVLTMIPYFEEITFEHIPREENQLAYALSTMLSCSRSDGTMRLPELPLKDSTNRHIATKLILMDWKKNLSFRK